MVDRELALADSLGGTGIYLDQADQFHVLETQVLLHGRDDDDGATGIAVRYGRWFCENVPASDRELLIQDCFVIGPGRGVPQNGTDYAGIRTDWVCGSQERDIDILSNWISRWTFAGLEFVQTADVQVGCNVVADNNRGADVYRDSEPTGSAIRFKENRLEALVSDSTLFALRTNDAVKTKLGPLSSGNRGKNRLKVNESWTKFIFENDPGPSDVLDAQDNFWYADTLFSSYPGDSTKINPRLAPTGFNIDYDPFLTDDSALPTCWPDTTGQGISGMIAGGRQAAAPEEPLVSGVVGIHLPTVLELGQAFPNPNRAGALLLLAVPTDAIGMYEVAVFDVQGRRVWSSSQEVGRAGRYRVGWNGRDAEGRASAPGVYFLRLSGPRGFAETRKITVLR